MERLLDGVVGRQRAGGQRAQEDRHRGRLAWWTLLQAQSPLVEKS